MSEEHLLAYYRWDDRTRWKLDSMIRDKDGKPVLAYVSDDKAVFRKYAQEGNTLWVVGLGPDETPTLEARLVIETRFEKGDKGILVEGSVEDSSFYGLNDASTEIMKLAFASERQKWSLRERQGSTTWIPGHGKHLRGPRRIAAEGVLTDEGYESPGIRPLTDLAKQALSHSIFISWKHKDNDATGERFLGDLTVALTKLGYSVWFDQLALGGPTQVEERKDKRKLMRRLLQQGLEQCKVVVGVWTEAYGEPSTEHCENWTKGEWEDFKTLKRLALLPGGQLLEKDLLDPHACVPIPEDPTPEDAAQVADDIAAECAVLL